LYQIESILIDFNLSALVQICDKYMFSLFHYVFVGVFFSQGLILYVNSIQGHLGFLEP